LFFSAGNLNFFKNGNFREFFWLFFLESGRPPVVLGKRPTKNSHRTGQPSPKKTKKKKKGPAPSNELDGLFGFLKNNIFWLRCALVDDVIDRVVHGLPSSSSF
jgi:hypothetical protein